MLTYSCIVRITRSTIIAIGLLVVLAAVMVAGLSRQRAAGRLSFAIGGTPDELDFWQNLLAEFRRESGIDIELLRQPSDSDLQRQSLVTALQARLPSPDVFLMDVAWVEQFAASGWLEPLDDGAGQLDPSVFFPQVVQQADKVDGRLIALPVYVDGGILYYRKDLLDQLHLSVPQTWQELVAASLAAQEHFRPGNESFYGFVWQGAQYEGLTCNWLEFAASGGGGFGEDLNVDSPANIEATQFMHDLIHRYGVSPPSTYTEMREEQARAWFQDGNALFERNWPYAWALHQGPTSAVAGKVGVAALPHFPGYDSVSAMGGWHIGISRSCDNKDAARRLVAFVLSYATQKRLALRLGWYPGRADVYDDAELASALPHLRQLAGIYRNLRARPRLAYYTLISNVMQRSVNRVLGGRQDASAALSQAQKQIGQIEAHYGH